MRTHIDLFSGIGGFALAARWANVQTIGFAEIDSYANKILAKNFPEVTNYGDINNVPTIDNVWLITGGFPCQPFSVAGQQRGSADDRWLWPKMAEIIDRIRPTWVLAENVPGIINMELDTVLFNLENIHYSTQAITIPAVGVDAPHRRERVWIVGNANNSRYPDANGCENVADSGCKLREEIWTESQKNKSQQTIHNKRCYPFMADANNPSAECGSWWTAEPELGRVAHGIPNRVDRLRGLGNAIVPQVAYQLICMMIAADNFSKLS
jgi:DNA (cytosine-5)-methyltransferase 1